LGDSAINAGDLTAGAQAFDHARQLARTPRAFLYAAIIQDKMRNLDKRRSKPTSNNSQLSQDKHPTRKFQARLKCVIIRPLGHIRLARLVVPLVALAWMTGAAARTIGAARRRAEPGKARAAGLAESTRRWGRSFRLPKR